MNSERIRDLLSGWYAEHFRALPWRIDATPYHVWLSEIMLQQTRIEAVLPYYNRFVSVVPDIATLAQLPEETLLKLWEGLGYYSRARNLQKAARMIMDRFSGELPADFEQLLSLPGIGEYTAGAIASIAFSIPVPAVDGNVMRLLSRLTGDDTDVLSSIGKKRFTNLAWELIPEQAPGRFNQALMELGETVCLPNTTPHCTACPLQTECVALRENTTNTLPVRIKKVKRRIEKRAVLLVRALGETPSVLIRRRADTGLLAGMWEFPNTLSSEILDALDPSIQASCVFLKKLPSSKHLFSHIEWHMTGYLYEALPTTTLPKNYVWATWQEICNAYPIPSAFRAYTTLLDELLGEES